MSTKQKMQATVETAFKAYNTLDYDLLASTRTPDYIHQLLPSSMNRPPMTNEAYKHLFVNVLKPNFTKFQMEILSQIYDPEQMKAVVHATLDVDSIAGPAKTEFVLMMSFNEEGKVVRCDEMVDVAFNASYFKTVMEKLEARKN